MSRVSILCTMQTKRKIRIFSFVFVYSGKMKSGKTANRKRRNINDNKTKIPKTNIWF